MARTLEPIAYSLREAATVTGFRRAAISLAVKSGELAAYRCGTRVRVLRTDLEAWIQKMERYYGA